MQRVGATLRAPIRYPLASAQVCPFYLCQKLLRALYVQGGPSPAKKLLCSVFSGVSAYSTGTVYPIQLTSS